MSEDSGAFVGRLAQARLIVLGDLVLERVLRGTAHDTGPVLRVTVAAQAEQAGGAAAVACAAATLGVRTWAAGVLGQDPQSGAVLRALAAAQVDPFAVVNLAGGATGEVITARWEDGPGAWSGVEIELRPAPPLEGEPARAMLAHLEPLMDQSDALLIVSPRAAARETLEAAAALARQRGRPVFGVCAGGWLPPCAVAVLAPREGRRQTSLSQADDLLKVGHETVIAPCGDSGVEVYHATGGSHTVAQGGRCDRRAWNHFTAAAAAAIAVGAGAEAAAAIGAAAAAAAATDPVTTAAIAHHLAQKGPA